MSKEIELKGLPENINLKEGDEFTLKIVEENKTVYCKILRMEFLQEKPASDRKKNKYPLRGTLLKYEKETEPVALDDWEALK